MAPEGNWKRLLKPPSEISKSFSQGSKEEGEKQIWFQLNKSTYALCNTCGDYAPNRASSFQVINLDKGLDKDNQTEEIIVTTCGPY
jgi:hypothetical protein